MKLNTEVLEKALNQLEKTIRFCEKEPDAEKKIMLRTASIQSFEYTYELAFKMLRRQLEQIESAPEIERMNFRDLIRTGAEKGFIDEPQAWFDFREKRNLTSHAYDEPKAGEVYSALSDFAQRARFLIDQLKKYNK